MLPSLFVVVAVAALLLGTLWLFQRRLIYAPVPRTVPPAGAVLAGAREVTLLTADGIALGAWFVPPAAAKRDMAVLVAAGNAGNRSQRAPLAAALARQGLGVLLFDYRGYGGNRGRPTESGLARDSRAALRFLTDEVGLPLDRLLYFGESLGSAVVTELAVEHPPAGLVLRSPFTDLASVGRAHYPFLPVRTLLRDRYPLAEQLARVRVPTLIVYGSDDRIVPPDLSRSAAAAAAGPARLLELEGTDHNDRALLDGATLVRAVVELADRVGVSIVPRHGLSRATVRLALAGDTMLGREVGRAIVRSRRPPVAREISDIAAEADLFVLNLECCISDRGERWPKPGKPFFFRAPPVAAELLAEIGVDAVTLANNHALDYGFEALLDTLEHLRAAGIATAGAGADLASARQPRLLSAGGMRVALIGASDHPRDYAAGPDRPGIAYADLRTDPRGGWLEAAVAAARDDADAVLVSPHWGPNMTVSPPAEVRRAAVALVAAGASVVAGHSAHVFHGVHGRVLYDLGGFVDDYAVNRRLRNDLGLLFLVDLDARGPRRLEAVPLKLERGHTRLATGEDAEWIRRRFTYACAQLGTTVTEHEGRLLALIHDAASRHA
jgi:poly-gamma-glutamate capsule biosynthesis protein CapA/YwtB (metallophosphatase superfamily)/alpha-beta hydrolase superfamily lysophospholipase